MGSSSAAAAPSSSRRKKKNRVGVAPEDFSSEEKKEATTTISHHLHHNLNVNHHNHLNHNLHHTPIGTDSNTGLGPQEIVMIEDETSSSHQQQPHYDGEDDVYAAPHQTAAAACISPEYEEYENQDPAIIPAEKDEIGGPTTTNTQTSVQHQKQLNRHQQQQQQVVMDHRPSADQPPSDNQGPTQSGRPSPTAVSKTKGNGGYGGDDGGGDKDDDDESSDDSDDEERGGGLMSPENDPYVYSDDSASLSDAYFFPTDDELARPLRYRDPSDPSFAAAALRQHNNNHQYLYQHQLFPFPHPPPSPHQLFPTNHHSSGGGTPPFSNSASPQYAQYYPREQLPLQYPVHSYNTAYGSMNPAATPDANSKNKNRESYQQAQGHHGSHHHNHHQYHLSGSSTPPLWVEGSIAEDRTSEFNVGINTVVGGDAIIKGASSRARRERRRQRRLNRELRLKQQQQAARERAVCQIRGQPQQVTTWQDPIFGILFCVQLILVLLCAIVFGLNLIHLNGTAVVAAVTTVADTTTTTTSSSATPAVVLSTAAVAHEVLNSTLRTRRSLAELVHNTTTGQIRYADDSISNRDAPDDPFHVRVPTTITKLDDGGTTSTAAKASSSSSSNIASSSTVNPAGTSKTKKHRTESGILDFTFDYENVVSLVGITGFYACILTYISFGFMLILARALIQVMLVFSVLLALGWGIIGLTLDPYGVISVMGFAALLLTLGYTLYNWGRIPFAATNLHTALSAMRCTADITILGVVTLIVAFGWCMVWSTAFVGIVNAINAAECQNKDACQPHLTLRHTPLYLLLLFSFYWTNLVIRNVVRVTVASAIGTWWFHPQDISPFCTSAVRRPLLRSLTKSLGSICLASLVIAPAQCALGLSKCFCGSHCTNAHDDEKEKSSGDKGTDGHGNPAGQSKGPNSGIPSSPGTDGLLKTITRAMVTRRDSMGYDETEESKTVIDDNTSSINNTQSGDLGMKSKKKSEDVTAGADNDSSSPPESTTSIELRRWAKRIRFHLRSCNRWSFTYIGMYGYSFQEAGERAIQLFETREWLDVVGDNLIQNVLCMASVVIGGSTGTFAVVVEETDGYYFSSFHMPTISAFLIGSVLGFILSNILLLGVVGSAVNTVLVCFAAGPFEFDKNHPRLSREMREVWSQQVWEPSE